MIFCGDTVFPFHSEDLDFDFYNDFFSKAKVVNLEALIVDAKVKKKTKGIPLSNSEHVISFLKELNVVGVGMANNHINDFDLPIEEQKRKLATNGIFGFGAGDSLASAMEPFRYEENGQKYAVLAFGWDVIGCTYADNNNTGVNPFEYNEIKLQVRNLLAEDPSLNVVTFFHCNYEFELYPQPGHRELFFKLIEIGVKGIFCHHPHIVGGYEIYKDVPIFYSLGNFYLPETNYHGYDLKYSEGAKVGLCVDFSLDIKEIKLYWTYKSSQNKLSLMKEESLFDSEQLKELSEFRGLSHSDYVAWFKCNRLKNKLLPIYVGSNSYLEKLIKNCFVKFRQNIIDFLVAVKVK